MTATSTAGEGEREIQKRALRVADWAVPILLVLLGFALIVGGAAVLVATDTETIVEAVADGTIQSDVFSDADLVDVTVATLEWTGIGLVVTGLLGWVGALAYVVYRRRVRRREATTGLAAPDGVTNALVGAVVSVVVSFVPFSSVVGGFVAGYLQRGDRGESTRVGALAGLFTVLPVAVLVLFVVGGLAAGVAEVGATGGALLILSGTLFALLSALAVTVGLSALGGYLAARAEERSDRRTDDRSERPPDRPTGVSETEEPRAE